MKKFNLIKIFALTILLTACNSGVFPYSCPYLVKEKIIISKEDKKIHMADIDSTDIIVLSNDRDYRKMFIDDGWEIITFTDESRKTETSKNEKNEKTAGTIITEQTRVKFFLAYRITTLDRVYNSGFIQLVDINTGRIIAGIVFQRKTQEAFMREFMNEVHSNIIIK